MKNRREFLISAGLFTLWPHTLVQISPKSTAAAMSLPRAKSPTYVIAQPCIDIVNKVNNVHDSDSSGCNFACTAVCPVDAIHPNKGEEGWDKEKQLYIDADACIDCGACEPECPVQAVFHETEVPDKWKDAKQTNANYYGANKKYKKKKP